MAKNGHPKSISWYILPTDYYLVDMQWHVSTFVDVTLLLLLAKDSLSLSNKTKGRESIHFRKISCIAYGESQIIPIRIRTCIFNTYPYAVSFKCNLNDG